MTLEMSKTEFYQFLYLVTNVSLCDICLEILETGLRLIAASLVTSKGVVKWIKLYSRWVFM